MSNRRKILIGCAGLHRPDWHTPKMDIGFWCRSSRSKQGYIAEAVQALLAMGFDQLGLARIEIITDELNASARKVAEKAGLQLEGIMRNERRAHDGVLRNTCVYAACAATPK
ncbi:MAG: GNAT family N-acetyltransferase [Burkholderiales bacterium]|nr:GNAT family N-acetyltransferase [Burkholderiales bacterium]